MPEDTPQDDGHIFTITHLIYRCRPGLAGRVMGVADEFGSSYEAHVVLSDGDTRKLVRIARCSSAGALADAVSSDIEKRLTGLMELELQRLSRDFADADQRRAEAEDELTRMREKFGPLPEGNREHE